MPWNLRSQAEMSNQHTLLFTTQHSCRKPNELLHLCHTCIQLHTSRAGSTQCYSQHTGMSKSVDVLDFASANAVCNHNCCNQKQSRARMKGSRHVARVGKLLSGVGAHIKLVPFQAK